MVLRPAALGLLGGAHELVHRSLVVACVVPVARERADRLAGRTHRALEELGHARVAARAVCARQEVVGDVADQGVREGVLLLAFDDRRGLTANEVATLELLEQVRQVASSGSAR